MNKFQYRQKRFDVRARRKGRNEKWTEWTQVDDYEEASKHAKRIEAAGFEAKIIDKGERK